MATERNPVFSELHGYFVKDAYARERVEEVSEEGIENAFYDEITYKKTRNYDTDCYIAYVPKYDSNGELIAPYVAYGNTPTTPIVYAQKNETTLTVNCQLAFYSESTGQFENAITIGEGVVLTEKTFPETVPNNFKYLGIKNDRELAEYNINSTTSQAMLSAGCENAFPISCKLIENGIIIDNSEISGSDGTEGLGTTPAPRMAMGVKTDGTFVFIACDGRTDINTGLTLEELSTLLLNEGCFDAWNFDGGGGTSMMIKGSKINRNIDGGGTTDRIIHYTLNFKKPIEKNGLKEVYAKISEEKQNTIQQIIPYVNKVNEKATSYSETDSRTITANNGLTMKLTKVGKLVQMEIEGTTESQWNQWSWNRILDTLPFKPVIETKDTIVLETGPICSFIITASAHVQIYPRSADVPANTHLQITSHYICE